MTFAKLDEILKQPVYGLPQAKKRPLLLDALKEVTQHHYDHCVPYAALCDRRGITPEGLTDIERIPFLPTPLFKDNLLLSIPPEQLFRELRSSATTSGTSSRMGLDKQTNRRQTKCFSKVVFDRIGNKRFKFIVLDDKSSVGRSDVVSARSSTIRSLLFCAKSVETCLSEEKGQLSLDRGRLETLLTESEAESGDLLIFGFTFILYKYVVKPLLADNKTFRLPEAKVVHIGGWKKLESEKISPEKLQDDLCRCFGVDRGDVVDLYGFTEQGGMLYPTCSVQRRHVPSWGEVIVRHPVTLEPLPPGTPGLLQFLTPIQTSYPGHSVLTEDVGEILGIDDCPCGRKGTTFRVTGRALHAEVRGCGDIMADKFA